jgi:hypothetical protein
MWATMAFHDFPEELQGCLAITALRDKAFKDFPLVIDCLPKIARLAFNLHGYLVQVPLPVRICAHLTDPFSANLSGKHWAKSVPRKPNRLMADVDAAFVQKIYHIAKRKRETTHIITARRMISELVLTHRKGERFVIQKG